MNPDKQALKTDVRQKMCAALEKLSAAVWLGFLHLPMATTSFSFSA